LTGSSDQNVNCIVTDVLNGRALAYRGCAPGAREVHGSGIARCTRVALGVDIPPKLLALADEVIE